MTSTKRITARIATGIVLQATLIASVGCSSLFSHFLAETECFQPHCEGAEGQASKVKVGGQVHQPRELDIGGEGLTLRRALMSAGGARELAVADAKTTADPERTSKLNRLSALAKEQGKLEVDEELAMNLPDVARELSLLPLEQLGPKIEQTGRELDAQVEDLASSYSEVSLKLLKDYSRDVGGFQEKLDLSRNLSVRQYLNSSQQAIEAALRNSVENEANVLNTLLASSDKVSLRSVRAEFLVALERRSANPPVTYYFPYDLTIAGQPGEIELQDGDSVDVVDIRETELNPNAAGQVSGPNTVAIQGYVDSPGPADGLLTIGSVHARSVRTIDDARSVWMLVRPSPTGQGDRIFVLPDRLVTANGAVAAAPTAPGDIYAYTILPQVPIVLETLLTETVERGKQHCLDRLGPRRGHWRERVGRRCSMAK